MIMYIGYSLVKSMLKEYHMASVERYKKMVSLSKKDKSSMEKCKAMACRSIYLVTILETLKITKNMAKEQKNPFVMTEAEEPMWVPGKAVIIMVQAN